MKGTRNTLLACMLVLGLVPGCEAPALPGVFAVAKSDSPGLVVRVSAPRRIQAVVADVDHLLVTVKAADGAEPTRRIDKADFAGTDASVTFENLASGTATVSVRALDAQGKVLGSATQDATVTPGVLTTVSIPLPLSPVYTQQPAPATTPGDLGLDASFRDGHFMPAPAVTGNWGTQVANDVPFYPTVSFVPDSAQYAHFYIEPDSRGGLLYNSHTVVMNVLSGGAVVQIPTPSIGAASDGQTHVWVIRPDSSAVHRHALSAPNSPLSVPLPAQPAAYAIRLDAQDHAWIANGTAVSRVAPDGSVVGHYDVGGQAGKLAIHQATGEVWVIVDGQELVHLAASGAVLGRTSAGLLPGDALADVAVDSDGQVWVPQPLGRRVVKLAPDGAVRRVFPAFYLPEAVACGPDGHVYVATVKGVLRIAPDGTMRLFAPPVPLQDFQEGNWSLRNEMRLSVAGDGTVWFLSKVQFDMGFYVHQIAP